MITGWIGLESVLLPILITHQNSIWFWLLSRNFLLCFISVHSCITINETSVFITMEFSGWYIFDQDQNDEIQWRMLCRQKILKVWHPELLMKYLSQWQNFVFIMSDTKFTLQLCPSVEWLQSWRLFVMFFIQRSAAVTYHWSDCWFSLLAATHFLVYYLGEFGITSR